jgi:hypothetical protein
LPLENPAEQTQLDSVLVPWAAASAVELRRISPVWYRLRIGTPADHGRVSDAILDAGIRCTDELAPEVRRTIEWHLAHAYQTPQIQPPPA